MTRVDEEHSVVNSYAEAKETMDCSAVWGEHVAHKAKSYDPLTRAHEGILHEADRTALTTSNLYCHSLQKFPSESKSYATHVPPFLPFITSEYTEDVDLILNHFNCDFL
jgi:hypothetical protein